MNLFKEIFREISHKIVQHFPAVGLLPIFNSERLDSVNRQLEKAIEKSAPQMIFLISPFGSGKTTQLNYFFRNNPQHKPKYRSLAKADTLEVAFLQLTNFLTRLLFIVSFLSIGVALIQWVPELGSLPLFIFAVGFFTKTFGNQIYILQQILSSIFRIKPRIIVIEDLEKSSLNSSNQFVFLSSLWRYNTIYIITLGYPPHEQNGALKLIETAVKLGGTIIELPVEEAAQYEMIQNLDPDFPFQQTKKDQQGKKGWLSLFTFRELIILQQQVLLREEADLTEPGEMRKLHYVEQCLRILKDKLTLANRQLTFIEETREVKGYCEESYSEEQIHCLRSFFFSLSDDLRIKKPKPFQGASGQDVILEEGSSLILS
jgi:hypothetical protein